MNIELLSTVSHKWLSVLCFYTLFLLGILVVLWLHISALSLCTGLHVHYHHLLFNPTRGSSISSESADMLSCLWTIQIVHSPSEGDRRLTREEKALRFCAYRKGQREGRELRTEGLCVSYLYQGPGMGLWGLYPSSVRAVVRLILCFRSPSLAVVGQCLSAEFEHTHLHNFFFFFCMDGDSPLFSLKHGDEKLYWFKLACSVVFWFWALRSSGSLSSVSTAFGHWWVALTGP